MITEGERKRRRIKRQGTEYREVYCQKGVIEFMRQGLISKGGVLHVIYRYASLAVYGINYTSLALVTWSE